MVGVGTSGENDVSAERLRLHEAIGRAISWHARPPIRADRPGAPAHGAVLHGIDARTGAPMGVYTEITGYAISLLVFLAENRGEPDHLELARQSADFLMRIQSPERAYPQMPDPAAPAPPVRLYSFDTAACVVGLARLSRAVREERYLASALEAGRWLLSMQLPDGSFLAQAISGRPSADPGGFYGDRSCIHAKIAMALLELHSMTRLPDLRAAAIRACDYTLTLQAPDGAFWSRPDRRYVFTHAHGYACEGLLFAGELLGDGRYMRAARLGIDWLARHQRGDGSWLSSYRTSLLSPRRRLETILRPRPSDAAAQAARLFSLERGRWGAQRRAAVRFLLECQDPGGGFYHRRTALGFSPFLYTWCAQFAIQAMIWDADPALPGALF